MIPDKAGTVPKLPLHFKIKRHLVNAEIYIFPTVQYLILWSDSSFLK